VVKNCYDNVCEMYYKCEYDYANDES